MERGFEANQGGFLGGGGVLEKAIVVTDLYKHYGAVKAVDGISLEILQGEVFTLLGPNGAGKTTTVEILEGLKEPDSGELVVLGQKSKKISRAMKDRMGVVLQQNTFMERITVKETFNLFASFFSQSLPVKDIIAKVALEEKTTALVETLSGGQKQRLAIGLALLNNPSIIFLDEPTTGLDPQARRNIWELIEELKEEQKTIILTTHYMEEAEKLSDYIYIMDHGQIIARGTPEELVAGLDQDNVIEFTLDPAMGVKDLDELGQIFPEYNLQDNQVNIYVRDMTDAFSRLLTWSREKDFSLENLMFRRPNLEDVFLDLTGKGLRD